MKLKVLKKINIIILFLFSLFPLVNVQAASQTHHNVSLVGITSAHPGTYNMGPSSSYRVSDQWIFHEITDGSNSYLAYCLNHAKNAPNADGVIHDGIDSVVNDAGTKLSDQQKDLLLNVLASGYQYSGSVTNFVNNASTDSKHKAIATQIIVWEIISGGRTNYEWEPNNIPNNSYSFISSDGALLNKYKEILNDASSLADESIPSSFNNTYIMHWSDSESQYKLQNAINVGNYRLDTSKNLDNIVVEGTSSLIVYSPAYFNGSKEIPLKYVKGNTTLNGFKWFEFNNKKNNVQDFALGNFGLTKTGKFYVSVEKGTFRLAKYNDNGELLKGAVFDILKCSDVYATSCSPFKKVDLTKQAYQDIELTKSGYYLFSETKVPFGYDRIPDFIVQFNISDNGVVSASHNSNNVQIKDNNTLKIQVSPINKAKSFKIRKVDASTTSLKEVKGASFKIKNSKGKYVKFNEVNGAYRYSDDGTIDTLKNANLSTYTISLLPEGEYVLEEVGTPYPYNLSSKQIERETKFKIDKDANLWEYNYTTNKYARSTDLTIDVKNFKTKVKIVKNGKKAEKLEGVVFELWNSSKTKQIPVKTMANGEYEYNRDSNAEPIQLITNNKGEIIINYLPDGSYNLKEIKTVNGNVIDESVEWTDFKVEINRESATTNLQKTITNAKAEFCFYKIDEDGNYLDDGKFKLQIYNEEISKFEDIPLIFDKSDSMFTIDSTYKSDIYTFSPISNGQTCFKDVPAKTRYRVVEIEAPEGFILPKANEAQAELIMNENGYAIGAPIIINRKITVGEGAEAQAELIINIQTGQNRIHYIVIIGVLLLIITGLFILKKKTDKK